ncbi:MAG: hypothetical protein LBO76_04670 [Treponema sp.]|jgi:hypothetical protein|nr:hypothetical protein [Treponema sp.]
MPSQILHVLFGEDVMAGIGRSVAARFGPAAEKALAGVPGDHRGAFALGCQGPDIFYHSQGRRPVGLEYGTLLHRRGIGLFTAGLLGMALPGPPETGIGGAALEAGPGAALGGSLGAYALGFMTHAALDREAHPYIIYKSEPAASGPGGGPARNGSRYHAFFERIIDLLMLRELRGEEFWDQEAVLARICGEPPPGLKGLIARALVLAFPERAGKDGKLGQRIDNTFADCARFYRLTSPRSGFPAGEPDPRLLAYVYPERLPAGLDFLNMEKAPWYYPAGAGGEDRRSFPEIYAGAVSRAVSSFAPLIAACLETGIFPVREAELAIGNGGLSIHDGEGRPCAATRSAPLPLDRVLRQQAELRGLKAD